MEWVVTTGKSVDEAKDAALDQLGVDEDEAEFEIIEEPKTGLFGRVRSEAQVRARVKPTQPRPKVERRDRRRRSGSEGSGTASTGGSGGRNGGGRGNGNRSGGRPGGADADAGSVETDDAAVAADAGDATSGGRAEAPARRSPSGGSDRPRRDDDRSADRGGRHGRGRAFPEEIANMNDQQEAIVGFVDGLVGAFGLQATVEAKATEDAIEVNVVGDDLGLLIGPRGATLQSIQDLARAVLQRDFPDDRHARVRIDVGGYRERRRQALERFVRSVADEVMSSGRQKALEPMSSSDRKIVHDTANLLDGVSTLSEGQEPNRRVVIIPADAD